MTTKISRGLLILPDRIAESDLYVRDGSIAAVTDDPLPFDREIDAHGCYVAPGFIDIHLHGGGGCEFIDGTPEAVKTAANIHAAHGTTTMFPTLSAYDHDRTVRALEVIRSCRDDKDLMPDIAGVHLEGPYFSPKQSGAQDPAYIRVPSASEYEGLAASYGDLIRRWSFAPELPGSDAFMTFLNENGIVASAGHTDAEFSHMTAAYKKGLRLVTHLYSCTSTIRREGGFRILGVTESAYYYDDITAEVIADGCHLPPELLHMVYKLKGEKYTCLVTDAIRYAGMTGTDQLRDPNGNVPYIIEDGVAKLADRSAFAGSIAVADVLIRTCVMRAGIPLLSAVRMMTEVPARIMGLKKKGSLREGCDADIVLLNKDLTVRSVMIGGTVLPR